MTYSSQIHSSSAIFNPEKLVRQIKQSQSRAIAIIEIIDRLISNGTTPISESREAFRREQPHQSAHMLHSIKGSISNIGGMRVVEVIEDLEGYLEKSAPSKHIINTLFDCLIREYDILLAEAKKWLKHQRSQLMSKSALKAARDEALVCQFKQHLENNNLKACDIFHELQDILKSSLSDVDFQGLDTFMHKLEFDKALQSIESV